jgi:hypothetical protein
VTGGLAAFVVVGSPEGDRSIASASAWITAGALVGVATVALVALAVTSIGPRRALYLGVATGTVYGFTAVLTKATVDLLEHGGVEVLGHWQLYVLLAVSVVGLILNQSAFQAGHVAASLPAIAIVNPVLSSTFAVSMFGEHLEASGPLAVTVTVVSIVAMVGGTVALARSPLVTHEEAGERSGGVGARNEVEPCRSDRREPGTPASSERPVTSESGTAERGGPSMVPGRRSGVDLSS